MRECLCWLSVRSSLPQQMLFWAIGSWVSEEASQPRGPSVCEPEDASRCGSHWALRCCCQHSHACHEPQELSRFLMRSYSFSLCSGSGCPLPCVLFCPLVLRHMSLGCAWARFTLLCWLHQQIPFISSPGVLRVTSGGVLAPVSCSLWLFISISLDGRVQWPPAGCPHWSVLWWSCLMLRSTS